VELLAPSMVRVVLGGEELRGFTSLGFDDHVKLIFPPGHGDGSAGPGTTAMRDFTPRRFDADAAELWIDFFLHDAGPAASWAAQAEVGQPLEVGGPKGSAIISNTGIDTHVLIGDETALPAIGRRLEELPAGTRALVVVEVDAGSEWPAFVTAAAAEVVWVSRDGRDGAPAHELIDALGRLEFPPERCYAWVAVESQSARAIRRYLLEERGFAKKWIKAAGYWKRGAVSIHETHND
jgi:NADPH-dependent ferric siderophore reductase